MCVKQVSSFVVFNSRSPVGTGHFCSIFLFMTFMECATGDTFRCVDAGKDSKLSMEVVLNQVFASLHTNGDGACALHSLLGVPHYGVAGWELKARDARSLVIPLFGHSLDQLRYERREALLLMEIEVALLHELLLPCLENDPAAEGESAIFFRTLAAMAPDLISEIRQVRRDLDIFNRNKDTAKTRRLEASKALFEVQHEKHLVRPLAQIVGDLPCGEDFLNMSREQLDASMSSHNHECTELLQEAMCSDHRGKTYVAGSYPRASLSMCTPVSKYAALFDQRLEFESIRKAFLERNTHSLHTHFMGVVSDAHASGVLEPATLNMC